jgi:hypothetical protein
MAVNLRMLLWSPRLPVLGDGDWEIALAENYPPIVVSPAWRAQCEADAAERFARWVLEGDPSENFLDTVQSRLTRFKTWGDWAGDIVGYSLDVDVWANEDWIEVDLLEALEKLVEEQIRPLELEHHDWKEIEYRDLSYDEGLLINRLYDLILEHIGPTTTRELWQRYEASARAKLKQEKSEN